MRNAESNFSTLPHANIGRSKFNRPQDIITSFNVGDLIPFYVDEVLPGDTHQIQTAKLVRLQTLVTPPMANIWLDTYYFFVPNRLVWEHWRELNGENTQSAWVPQVQYSVPQITAPSGGWNVGTIADYMGIPTGVGNISVNAMPLRAYALICNEWFRDENLSDPLVIPVSDSTVVGVNTGNYITDVAKGGLPFKVSKYHDYFTSALPSPLKNNVDVRIPMLGGDVPVIPKSTFHDAATFDKSGSNYVNMTFRRANEVTNGPTRNIYNTSGNSTVGASDWSSFGSTGIVPNNLWALTSSMVSSATINELRIAFQMQKLFEKDARGGTRYTEILRSHFGVISPDSRLQRPEYLGGNRKQINVNQIIQQSETSTTPQGTPTGLSVTSDNNFDFKKSFTEHGFIIGVCCVRYEHSYQQGLERFWSRKSRFDYYWPVFANLGEMAILNKEIYAQGSTVVDSDGNPYDEQVFGYQEAWADYRYKPNHVCGEMRSTYAQSLDVWHLADYYSSMPYLSDTWIREDKSTVDRVLAVQSSVSNQVFADIYVKNISTRPMPFHSIPGLIDHH